MTRYHFLLPALAGILLTLAACGTKEPGEDAVATVNEYEITVTELDHELAALGVENTRDLATRRAALQAIINRKLLAELAEKRELDRTPEYILQEQRMRELMLADVAIADLVPAASRSDPDAVAAFIANTEAAGGSRTLFTVETAQAAQTPKPAVMKSIEAAATLEELRSVLDEAGIDTQSASQTWDSATMPADLVRQLNNLAPAEPFVVLQPGGGLVAGVVRDRRRQLLSPDEARSIAEQASAQQSIMRRVGNYLEGARSSAEIVYREGYAPNSGEPEQETANAAAEDAEASPQS